GYDPWFVGEIAEIVRTEAEIKRSGLPRDASGMRRLKAMGFSDARLATLTGKQESDVARLRAKLSVHPVYKRIDTCAAEFAALTSYMYSTYESPVGGEVECEARPSDKRKAIILAAVRPASARGSSSIIAAATRVFRWRSKASKRS